MSITDAGIGGSADDRFSDNVRIAGLRALRTLLQGIAGAFPAAGVGATVLSLSYWTTFGYSCLAAGITAFVSFLQNMADFLLIVDREKPRTR